MQHVIFILLTTQRSLCAQNRVNCILFSILLVIHRDQMTKRHGIPELRCRYATHLIVTMCQRPNILIKISDIIDSEA